MLRARRNRLHARGNRLGVAVAATAVAALGSLSLTGVAGAAVTASKPVPRTALAKSFLGAPAAAAVGAHQAARMTVEVALNPRDSAGLARALAAVYDAKSPDYHHWIAKGAFAARFAPTAASTAAVRSYLAGDGLSVATTASPFLLRATGSAAQVEKAFGTGLENYRAADGTRFFANSGAVRIPTTLAGTVSGVIGLTNTVRHSAAYKRTPTSRAALTAAARAHGVSTPATAKTSPAYGDAPGGSGLTPSQTRGIYDAGPIQTTPATLGKGVVLAVYELSGYTPSDVTTFTKYFYGAGYTPSITDVNVDGGPVTPVCPTGDTCLPDDYSGDIEVDADIEQQLALAPDASVVVYNASDDATGQTQLDEYVRIASDDVADSISTSWGACEQAVGIGSAQAENTVFEQMALQGQSMFAASGDDGAFDCLDIPGTPDLDSVAVDDPASQPYVTGVGGTSLGTYDPKSNTNPTYPGDHETVWNPLDLCGPGGSEQYCDQFGAGGGGISLFWPRPAYQRAQGVEYNQARQVPDVSADADEFTPYAEYCTGSTTTNSSCATFTAEQPAPGWLGIGGTSLSSPLWAGVIADSVGYRGRRLGNANEALYKLYRQSSARFHDINGVDQSPDNNGLYSTLFGYDRATGLGTPDITKLLKSAP